MNKRQSELAKLSLEDEKRILKQLEKNYIKAIADIKKKIRILQADDITPSKAYRISFQQQLERQLTSAFNTLQSNNFKHIEDYLESCYKNGYLGTMYDLHGQGLPIVTPINQKEMIQAIVKTGDGIKLKNKLGVHTKELKKQVVAEIQRGFSMEASYTDIARNISSYGEADIYRSKLIARTEGHRVQNEAKMTSLRKAKSLGADIVKQWDSTLDGDTRPEHRKLDGQVREIEENFEVNGLSAMCPGAFGSPAQDCNCRCTMLQRARKMVEVEDQFQKLDNVSKEFVSCKDFEEWKHKYYSAVENIKDDVIINSKRYSYITQSQYQKLIEICEQNETAEEHHQIWYHMSQKQKAGYIQTSNSFNINSALRTDKISSLKPDDIKTINILNDVISRNPLDNNYVADRYVGSDFLDFVFGVKLDGNRKSDFENTIDKLSSFIGQTRTDKGFMSASLKSSKNVFTDRPIKLKILLDKDIKAYVTSNKIESEAILGTGSEYELIDVQKLSDINGHNWIEMLIRII